MNTETLNALKSYLYQLADDELIIGHRNSEWTGLGPVLEEDIAFASMAQDEIGHAQAYYMILHELGEQDPDTIAFYRSSQNFRCCQLVEFPIGEYDFSLARHFLYETHEMIRLKALSQSPYEPLANLCRKLIREEKYHLMHALTWFKQLSNGGEEARSRMQNSLNLTMPMAYSLFEVCEYHNILENEGLIPSESKLEELWEAEVKKHLSETPLTLPEFDKKSYYGGRQGKHSEHLEPLITEMSEVFIIDPTANW